MIITLTDKDTSSTTKTQQLSGGATDYDITLDGTSALPAPLADGTINISVTVTNSLGGVSTSAAATALQDTATSFGVTYSRTPDGPTPVGSVSATFTLRASDFQAATKSWQFIFRGVFPEHSILSDCLPVSTLTSTLSADVVGRSYWRSVVQEYDDTTCQNMNNSGGWFEEDGGSPDNPIFTIQDPTAPAVITKLGDGLKDMVLSVGDTSLVFSKELSASSTLVVEEALTAGADKVLSYAWSGATLKITATETTTFANDVIVTVIDLTGVEGKNLLLVDSKNQYIQDAIDAAGPGDTIVIPSGTYKECLLVNKSLALTSKDPKNTIIDLVDCGVKGIIISASNVNINNFTITNSSKLFVGSIGGNFTKAVYVSTVGAVSGLVLDSLMMTQGQSAIGIALDGVSGRLTNNNVQDFCSGIILQNSSSTNGLLIDGNTISNNGIRSECSSSGEGIAVKKSANVTIKNNVISNNNQGIHVYYSCDAIVINNNKITGNKVYGVLSGTTEKRITATMNWWGGEFGPAYSENAKGAGDSISSMVDYMPWYGDVKLTSLRGVPVENKDKTKSYTVSEELKVASEGYDLIIPTGTVVSGDSSWTGEINPPTVTTVSLPEKSGYTKTLGSAIEVGFSSSKLILSQAAKLTFPGESGKLIGYTRPGESFTEITAVCKEDSQTWADAKLSAEGDCKIDSGNDLIVWTKHFTSFATYTQTQNAAGGGLPPASDAYANWLAQSTASTSGQQPANREVQQEPAGRGNELQGQVLGTQRFAEGSLIRAIDEIDVYMIKYVGAKQFKRLILNPSAFNSYQLSWDDVLSVEKSAIDSFITSDLVQVAGSAKVYKLTASGDAGSKQWIKTAEAFNRLGFDWDAIYEINAVDGASYSTGAAIK